MDDSYDLLHDACNVKLPLNAVREEYLFSRFALLRKEHSGGSKTHRAQPLVIPRDIVVPGLREIYARTRPAATLEQMKGGPTLVEAWDQPVPAPDPPDGLPLAREVPIGDPHEVIATRTVVVDGRSEAVLLDGAAVQALLEQGRAVVQLAGHDGQGGESWVTLATPAIPALAGSGEPTVEIAHLAEFLAQPALRGPSGKLLPVPLAATEVRALGTGGSVRVTLDAEGTPLTVTLRTRADTGMPATVLRDGRNPTTSADPTATVLTTTDTSPTPDDDPLPFRQRWELLGYSRGALLSSLSLAPQEDTTIEVFSWDRRKRSTEVATATEAETTTEASESSRDSREVLHEVTRESDIKTHVGADLGVQADEVHLGVQASGDTQDKVRDFAKDTHSRIKEAVAKATARVRASRQTKVTESIEQGREERVTRKIHNANPCRTLNFDYFEILANYTVSTQFDADGARLCVLVKNPLTVPFDRALLREHERTLRPALLAPDLVDGFAAARLLEARSHFCQAACARCQCTAGGTAGDETSLVQAVALAVAGVSAAFKRLPSADPTKLYDVLTKQPGTQVGQLSAAAQAFREWAYLHYAIMRNAALFDQLMELWLDSGKAASSSFADDLWWVVKSLPEGGLDPKKLFDEHQQDIWDTLVVPSMTAYAVGKKDPALYPYLSLIITDQAIFSFLQDNGLAPAVARFVEAYQALLDGREAAAKASAARADALAKFDDEATAALTDAYPAKTVAEAIEREAALLAHLLDHRHYYRYLLWRALDPGTQLAYLYRLGNLAGYVYPQTVGYLGSLLAFPVKLTSDPSLEAWFATVIRDNSGLAKLATTQTVTLPTAGITMETRLGSCDGCEEHLLKQRDVELQLREALLDQAKLETERYALRLKQPQPLLDDPTPTGDALRVVLEQPKTTPPTP
jgi:hypothetical protein